MGASNICPLESPRRCSINWRTARMDRLRRAIDHDTDLAHDQRSAEEQCGIAFDRLEYYLDEGIS
jgi:hypothetical protein